MEKVVQFLRTFTARNDGIAIAIFVVVVDVVVIIVVAVVIIIAKTTPPPPSPQLLALLLRAPITSENCSQKNKFFWKLNM